MGDESVAFQSVGVALVNTAKGRIVCSARSFVRPSVSVPTKCERYAAVGTL